MFKTQDINPNATIPLFCRSRQLPQHVLGAKHLQAACKYFQESSMSSWGNLAQHGGIESPPNTTYVKEIIKMLIGEAV